MPTSTTTSATGEMVELEMPAWLADPLKAEGPQHLSMEEARCQINGEAIVSEAKRFLSLLDPTAEEFTFQTFDDNKVRRSPDLVSVRNGKLEDHLEHLGAVQRDGGGVFINVQQTDLNGRKIRNIKRVRAVYQEDDGGYQGKYPLEPHIVVESSPGKYHRYWLVDGLTFDEFNGVMATMVNRYGSDRNAKDLSRVLRLPGFLHQKSEPFMVRIVHESGAEPYSRDELLGAFPPTTRTRTATANTRTASLMEGLTTEQGIKIRDLAAHAARRTIEDKSLSRNREIFELGGRIRRDLGWSGQDMPEDTLLAVAATALPVFERDMRPTSASGKESPMNVKAETDTILRGLRSDQRVPDWSADTPGTWITTKPGGSVTLVCGSSVKPEAIDWLWDGWLAKGKFHVLAGSPGTGKTTIATALGASVSCGGRWPDGSPATVGKVLIWSGEDDPADTLIPRFIACGANTDNVYIVGDVGDGDGKRAFDPATDTMKLAAAAEDIGGVDLLIVDPIVSAVQGDSHKNAEVRRSLQPLVEMASEMGCALLGISHFSKGTSGKDPIERVTGSIAFGALARVVFAAAKMPDDDLVVGNRLFCRSKSNIGPDDGGFRYDLRQIELADHPGVTTSCLVWGVAEQGSARDLLNRTENTLSISDENESREIDEWLCDFLKSGGGCRATNEVFGAGKKEGYTKDQLKAAKRRKKIFPKKMGFSGGWGWHLPDEELFSSLSSITSDQGSDFP